MAWKKGETGNPKGRPKTAGSLAEAIRRTVDPDEVVAKLLKIAQDSPSDQTKLRALEILLERGYKKPAQVIEVGPADPFEDMSEEELRALIAEDDRALEDVEAELVEGGAQAPALRACNECGCTTDPGEEGCAACRTYGTEAAPAEPGGDLAESRSTTLLPGVLRRRPNGESST